MSVRYNNVDIGDGDGSNEVNGESVRQLISIERQLSRPTDHYRRHQRNADKAVDDNPYAPPPKHHANHYFGNFFREPIAASLNTFSRVTNAIAPSLADEDWISSFNLIRAPGSAERVVERELVTIEERVPLIPEPLPPIACSSQQYRLEPLTSEEFTKTFVELSRDELLERVFRGGISDNEVRRRIWPIVLGLTHEIDTEFDWTELNHTFNRYYSQWNLICDDQESRFTAYRERKSLIERDVIRCDRTHAFYKGINENLEKLKSLLLTYTMFDFDTGYVQGMSDVASPLLFVMDGDVMKAFWCLVQVMKLIKRNFELSQQSIKFQLEMLWKLIELTDPSFANYLANKDSTNCYFAFRWIVCQFKREIMKTEEDEYNDCLILWESIWTSHVMRKFANNSCENNSISNNNANNFNESNDENNRENTSITSVDSISAELQSKFNAHSSESSSSPSKQSTKKEVTNSSPKHNANEKRLTDSELYTLSICLSIIRRERDLIMIQQFDATDILKHFNTLQLNNDLHNILQHASTIWHWLIHDCGESLLYTETEQQNENNDDYDLLNELCGEDYYIINSASI